MNVVTESLEKVVEGGSLAQALFTAGVVKADGKPESKYAAKKGKKAAKVVDVAETPVVVVPEIDATDAMFGDLFGDIMGDSKDAANRVMELRGEAAQLISKAKSFNLRELEETTRKEIFRLEHVELFNAERMLYNELKTRYFSLTAWPMVEGEFLKLQDAWHDKNGDEVLKAKFQAKLDRIIENYPQGKMLDRHMHNLDLAKQTQINYECTCAEQEKAWADAVGKFNEANEIAKAHGWPVTEAKKGENKSK